MIIEITDLARRECLDRFHISDDQVMDVILHRDDVDIIKFDETYQLGLYSKKIFEHMHKRSEVVMLVLGHFKGEDLQVSSVFRISKEIYGFKDLSPLALLKSLVDHFGIKLTIGNQKAKFILKERIPVSKDQLQIVSIEHPVENFITCFYIRMEEDGNHAQCVLCFALDMDSYIASL